MWKLPAFIIYTIGTIAAAAIEASHSIHERRTSTATLWHRQAISVDMNMIIPVRIALAQQNLEAAEAELVRVSDPSSPHFTQYWTRAEIASWFAPSIQTVSAVTQWLNESSIHPRRLSRSPNSGWIEFNATVAETQRLLRAKYSIYTSPQGDITQLATDEYSLPNGLGQHIDFIVPTVHLGAGPQGAARRHRLLQDIQPAETPDSAGENGSFTLSSCHRYTTPDCLRAMYGIPAGNASHPNNSFAIFEPAMASWLPEDLDTFFNMFNPALVGQRPLRSPIDGGYWQDETPAAPFLNMEADLDFEYGMALAYPLPVTNYQVGDRFRSATLNNLLAALDHSYCGDLDSSIDPTYPDPLPGGYNKSTDCGTVSRPANVLSVSYAWDEVLFPEAYLQRQCLEFLKLGLQGITVVVSSADCGPASQSCECIDPSSPGNKSTTGKFRPTSPATCPFVTVVGGTQLPANASIRDKEVAFRHVSPTGRISTSGGGFSNVFARPSWQARATQEYLERQESNLKSLDGRYNPHGRGVPDVAANAANYVVIVGGQLMTVMGTSASAPTFASLVAKINDARLRLGKRTVGFMNPVLYGNAHAMRDITDGANYGCGGSAFHADLGWDPVTGLGTPEYNRLLDVYTRLP